MQTKPKANSVVTHRLNEDGTITFIVKGAGEFTLDPSKFHANITKHSVIHGAIQRVSDGGAMSRNPENGQPATPADKLARMERIARHMETSAVWGMKGPSGPRKPDAGLIVQALCATHAGGDVDKANRLIDGLATKRGVTRDEALAVWASVEDVSVEMARIKAKRVAATAPNADDLMAELASESDE